MTTFCCGPRRDVRSYLLASSKRGGESRERASRDIKTSPNTSTDRAEPGTQPVPEQYRLSTEGVLLFVSERAVRWCYSYLNESLTLVR
jgi:hypothetical protein